MNIDMDTQPRLRESGARMGANFHWTRTLISILTQSYG